MKYQNKKNKGFTLIEMMMAIAVFSIVMVMAMGALLNVIDSNNKARSIKTAINNISFALEGISKDMRMGTDYACGGDGSTAEQDCTDGVDTISFKSSKTTGGVDPYVYYQYVKDSDIGRIESCISTTGTGSCTGTYSPLTSSELILDSVKFYVLGVTNSKVVAGIRTQPRVIIVIKGTAGNKNKVKTQTTFDLQTGISQTSRIKI
jgi:prepilin-type N-terminal cleavage/methylation domain-containing protein